jgi:hypothetical protein
MPRVSLLLLVLLATPGSAGSEGVAPQPEEVYRQLRHEPVIRTRQAALEYLEHASADDLRRSAKICVDSCIKALLKHEYFGSLDRETQDALHTSLLKIRSSFWRGDALELADGAAGLRRVLEGEAIPADAGPDTPAGAFRRRVSELLQEVDTALAIQECARLRALRDWDAERLLDCALKGGPGD